MKRIEDIEKLTFAELEAIRDNTETPTPDGLHTALQKTIEANCAMQYLHGEKKTAGRSTFIFRRLAVAAGAAAVLCASVILTTSRPIRDTFDNPELAFAELEKTFSYISSKINEGMETACTITNKTNQKI